MMVRRPVTCLATLAVCMLLVSGQQEERKPPNIIKPTALESATVKYIPAKLDVKSGKLPWGIQCQAEAGQNVISYEWMKVVGEDMNNVAVSQPQFFQVDSASGWFNLTYRNGDYVSYAHDGTYICKAEVTFKDNNNAASFSPPITIKKLDLHITASQPLVITNDAYNYHHLECPLDSATLNTDDIAYSWYLGNKGTQLSDMDNGRIYIDTEGGLHFVYLDTKDATKNGQNYKCGIGSDRLNVVYLTGESELKVNPKPSTGLPPVLQFSNSHTPQQIYQPATLECIFSGYDPKKGGSPPIKWWDKDSNEILNANTNYEISADQRRLKINDVQKETEGTYFCSAENTVGKSGLQEVVLNIISAPVFVTKGPQDITKTEGEDAEFTCHAESLPDEQAADPPVWYINGVKAGGWVNAAKYKFTDSNRKLTIKSVDKASDVGCFQCMVKNNYGERWGDACLTVVLPITLRKFPNPDQSIEHGDVVDLTYKFTADDQSGKVSVTWFFKNDSFTAPQLPKFVEQFVDGADLTNTILNTSKLTEQEYDTIGGTYTLRISNRDTSKEIVVRVTANKKEGPPAPVVQSAGFPMWIIGVILGILVLILVIVIIVCCVCKRSQEGDYNVDKKEVGAGLDPKKELMEKGFDDYSRPNLDDYEDVPRQGQPYVPYDDVDAPLTGHDNKSLGEYSEEDEARLGFNEDGSFIGQYYKKDPSGPPPPNYENHSSIA